MPVPIPTQTARNRNQEYRPEPLTELQRAGDSTSKLEPAHLPFLDGLRALAALFVVLHHGWLQVWPPAYHQSPTGLTARLTGWLIHGHFAVALFIVLSGYSLMLSVVRNGGKLRKGTLDFYYRRAKRILPPYYLAMLLSLALIATLIGTKTGTHWDSSLPVTMPNLLARLLLLQDFTNGGAINHVFWSIALEWHYYLLFPLLVLCWRKIGAGTTTVCVLVLAAVGAHLTKSYAMHEEIFPFLALFVFGMLGATIGFDRQGNWPAMRRRRFWLPLAFVCFGLSLKMLTTRFFEGSDYVFGVGCLALLVGLERSQEGMVRTFLSGKYLVCIGGFSYSLYLTHAPLIQVFWQYGPASVASGQNADVRSAGLCRNAAVGGRGLSVLAVRGAALFVHQSKAGVKAV